MDIYLQMTIWLLKPQVWIIIGLAFIILEVMDNSTIFFLPMGIGAEIIALWIYLFNAKTLPLSGWYWILSYWIIISVLIAFIMSKMKKHKKSKNALRDEDINNY